jgi:GxxExxY protein
MMPHHPLTEKVIGCSMKVHSTLGPGFLESVYQNALQYELTKTSLRVVIQKPIPVPPRPVPNPVNLVNPV